MQYTLLAVSALAASVFAAPATSATEDLISVLSVLETALPSSLVALALTNSASASAEIASEFAAGETPSWWSALPSDIKTYLDPLATDSAALSSAIASVTNSSAVAVATTANATVIVASTGNVTVVGTGAVTSTSNSTGASTSIIVYTTNGTALVTSTSTSGGSSSSSGSGSSTSGSASSTSGSTATTASSSTSKAGAAMPTAVLGAGLAGAMGLVGLLVL